MNQRRLSAPPTRVFSVAWEQRAPLDIGDCGSVVPQLRYWLTLPRGLERGWHLSLQRPLGTQDQAVALAGEAGSRAGGAQSPSHLLSGGGGRQTHTDPGRGPRVRAKQMTSAHPSTCPRTPAMGLAGSTAQLRPAQPDGMDHPGMDHPGRQSSGVAFVFSGDSPGGSPRGRRREGSLIGVHLGQEAPDAALDTASRKALC